jgi:hypothetical protein
MTFQRLALFQAVERGFYSVGSVFNKKTKQVLLPLAFIIWEQGIYASVIWGC